MSVQAKVVRCDTGECPPHAAHRDVQRKVTEGASLMRGCRTEGLEFTQLLVLRKVFLTLKILLIDNAYCTLKMINIP